MRVGKEFIAGVGFGTVMFSLLFYLFVVQNAPSPPTSPDQSIELQLIKRQLEDIRAYMHKAQQNNVTRIEYIPPTCPPQTQIQTQSTTPTSPTDTRPSFYDLAKKWNTDKVNPHQYQILYEKYLPPLRDQPNFKMLEIGLGCGFPGASLATWHEYFNPTASISVIEYSDRCYQGFAGNAGMDKFKGHKIYHGDQSNRTFLHEVIDQSGGNFDMIIDDGGHFMIHQRNSIEELWHAVKPGGLYIIEDLLTSFRPQYNDSLPSMVSILQLVLEYMNNDQPTKPDLSRFTKDGKADYVPEIVSMDCMNEMCIMTKKK